MMKHDESTSWYQLIMTTCEIGTIITVEENEVQKVYLVSPN